MASKQERQQEKARARQKERREQAQKARKSRTTRAKAGIGQAASWPIVDAWISQDWYEWERVVHAVVARGHADGTHAAAIFEVDLADDGLRSAEARLGLQLGHVQGMLTDRSSDDRAMVSVDPAAIARLVHDGLAFRRKAGLAVPKGLDDALALLGDVDPEDSPYDFHFGHEGEDEDTEEVSATPGLLGRIKGWFARG